MLLSIPTLYSCGRLRDEPLTAGKVWVFSLFAFFFAIFILGTQLKAKAWRMGARDGINVNDY